ncbi:MAG: enoyl-CoA hydratase/isomerase family protein [Lachnospiraceae bacterium]
MKYAIMEQQDHICTVTINFPEKLNAVSTAVLTDVNEAFDKIAADKEIYCVILKGAGEKAFIGGADIKEMKDFDFQTAKEYSVFGSMVLNKIHECRCPVIAQIQGYCLGGGLEVAIACDIRIASDNSKFSQPEVSLGIMTGTGGSQRLQKLIGEGKAKELLLVGNTIDAQEAYKIGLLNHVVTIAELPETVLKMAQKIARNAPIAVATMKRAMNVAAETDYKTGNEHVNLSFGSLFTTQDAHDALSAFVNKEKLEGFHNR